MFGQNIQGCSFIVANTNAASLETYAVPTKIQLGLTGLGAGTRPEVGRNAALDSQDEIAQKVLDCGTKMLFITAGMGGGTGTGASPVIARWPGTGASSRWPSSPSPSRMRGTTP